MVTTIGWVEDAEGVAWKNTKVGDTQLEESFVDEFVFLISAVFKFRHFSSISIMVKELGDVITKFQIL